MTLGPLMVDVAGYELSPADRDVLAHPLVGGVILFARNYHSRDQVRELNRQIRAVRSPGLLIAVDQEGGRVQRFRDDFHGLPPLRWLGREYDIEAARGRQLALQTARLMAIELLDVGVDFSFAPVLDIDRGLCEVIGDRAAHTDPECVAALGLAYMQGMRQAGMAAVAKHFPGHGGVVGDSHCVLPEDRREYGDLLDDMRPYRSLIADGLRGVMMAHIRYAAVNPAIASFSAYWMKDVLRGEFGFAGAIFSDDLSMAGAEIGGSVTERAALALDAGADMALICNDRPSVESVLGELQTAPRVSSQARLAAMRSNRQRYAEVPYGSAGWDALRATVMQAQATPDLQLDG
ncbi:MAG: beta-N-acetylhexosaminidase [Gammaproteobacteria bacterium]|jgi:beta-N-acetylhexosaminidase|nr:beta-N-acetylhexosaminidase [Gammaproteobacteria bacterium]